MDKVKGGVGEKCRENVRDTLSNAIVVRDYSLENAGDYCGNLSQQKVLVRRIR